MGVLSSRLLIGSCQARIVIVVTELETILFRQSSVISFAEVKLQFVV